MIYVQGILLICAVASSDVMFNELLALLASGVGAGVRHEITGLIVG